LSFLRRISLTKLLLLCGATVLIGVSATALALALGSGPTPPATPLAQAIHGALTGARSSSIEGFTASIKLTDHLVEGSELANAGGGQGGGIASNPLLTGGSGRLWVSRDGRVRLELQAEKGDTELVYDGHTVTIYDASSNTVYRYTPAKQEGGWTGYAPLQKSNGGDARNHGGGAGNHEVPSVAKIEEAIAKVHKRAGLSGATPTDVGGRSAYTVRLSPSESGSLIGGAELSFDAANGLPLRAAVYSSTTASPVIELATEGVSYGPVADSVFTISPPPGATVKELKLPSHSAAAHGHHDGAKPNVTSSGHGITAVGVLSEKASGKEAGSSGETGGLPTAKINGITATELRTELGTILTFERAGTSYILAGAVEPSAVETVAKGL
jgi:outer membrane lipoprotein-sorting protein